MSQLIEQFKNYYRELTPESVSQLGSLYHDHIEFCDPAHCVSGLPALTTYFAATMRGVNYCGFEISEVMQQDDSAFCTWTMRLSHPRLRGGREISFEGASHIRFDDKIYYHRDYFDLGAMLYEHLPLMGRVIDLIKKRLAS